MATLTKIYPKQITICHYDRNQFTFQIEGDANFYQISESNIRQTANQAIANSQTTNIYGYKQFILSRRDQWKQKS